MTLTSPAVELDVEPLTATIGAEIRGIDLRDDLDESAITAIRDALLSYKVVFFPGQHLGPAEHAAFGRRFGELTPAHPVIPGIDGHPEVFEIDYTKARASGLGDDYRAGDPWHTDVTFVQRPPLGSILNAVVIPAAGGDTVFADLQAAYEALSPPIRALVDGLTAVHDGNRNFAALLAQREGGGEWEGRRIQRLEPVEHPVVRTHPETGRRNLFVNPNFTSHIAGVTRKESEAILGFLFQHMTRQEFLVRYRWRAGDLGFWDNRTTMHYAVRDYGTEHRVIQRVTIRGDEPR